MTIQGRVLEDLTACSREELLAKIAEMRAASQSRLTLKVTDKGGLSLYGLGRYPVTLYRSQWERLLGAAPTIKAFIADHSVDLAVKE